MQEDRTFYPDISGIGNIEQQINYVPFYLRSFLSTIFKTRKTDMKTRIAAIGQAIMQQSRPRSLMAPLQFAMTMRVHDDSPGLVSHLNKFGFCLSDDEAYLFKACAASDSPDPFSLMTGKFGWIIGDNVDHNKITLTGHDTIHVMGLMMTQTPAAAPPHRICRHKKDILKEKPIAKIEIREITAFNRTKTNIIYKSVPDIVVEDKREHLDMLWKISLAYRQEKPGWQGFMTLVTHGEYTGKASFHFLPMVDLDPNSWRCIYSVLVWGRDQCLKYDIIPMFTFDQPIWWNARQLKNHEEDLSTVILNLGAFHTDMSFLGAIGSIMKSSGLKQMLTLIYPENTVNHMLSGKAVYRAIRGYFLVDAALNIFIIKKYLCKEEQCISDYLKMFESMMNSCDENEAIDNKQLLEESKKFKDIKDKLKETPTGKLWVQFMNLMDHHKESLRAQRTSHYSMYKKSLQNRHPYFPASGHNNYAMSLQIFRQDLYNLKDTNPEAEKLFNEGYFFVRRSERYWAAIPPDLVIEQVLMASLKDCRSGLTHGRGIDELQRLMWLYSRPAFAHLKVELDHLNNTADKTVIKELTESRIKEDTNAILKILQYIEEHDPFSVKSEHLVDISTGVSYPKANAHNALEIGNIILEKMDGIEVRKYVFRKADRIKQMGEKVMAGKDELVIEPDSVFQRLLILANNCDVDLLFLFAHELSLYPPSMFIKNYEMRYADDKSQLTDFIARLCLPESTPEDKDALQIEKTVIDMGSMLRSKVKWSKGDTYGKIIGSYVKQAQVYPNCVPVFDGYSDNSPSTKYLTHLRRSSKVIPSHTVELAMHLPFNGDSKDAFFANRTNKQRFIDLLSVTMEDHGIKALHADGDADQLIAKTAVVSAKTHTTQVIGEDTDIFQLLVSQLISDSKGLYMITDKQNAKNKCLDIKAIRIKLGEEISPILPVLHAISGCDTTSKLFGIGKSTVMKKRHLLVEEAKHFLSPSVTHEQIEESGRKILCLLYDEKNVNFNLNELRMKRFEKNVIKSLKHVEVKNLPPTNSAAKYHSYRVYYQVQVWLGNESLHATDWGWELINGHLFPMKMDNAPAPESLLKIMKCGCTSNCDNNRCSCKKNGLFCTELCDNCSVGNCNNVDHSDHPDHPDLLE